MKFQKFIYFSTKNAFRRKSIAILAIFGIAIGIGLQVTLNTLSNGMTNQFNSLFNDFVGDVSVSESSVSPFQSNIPNTIIQDLRASNFSSEIKFISPEINLPTTLTSSYSLNGTLPSKNSGAASSITIMGIDLHSYLNVSTNLDQLTSNSTYFGVNSSNEIIISNSLLQANESVFDIGKYVSFQINSTSFMKMKIVGITSSSSNGAIGMRNNGDQSYNIWTSLDAATTIRHAILDNPSTAKGSARWFHYESRQLDSSNANPDSYTQVALKTSLTTINETNDFIANLQSFMDATYDANYQITSPQLVVSSFTSTQQTFSLFINLISIIAIIAGSMGIIIAQLVGVESRLKEFAILKASGWKTSHLVSEVILESISLGIIGAIVGLLLSTFFISILKRIFRGTISSLIIISPGAIIYSVILALLIAIIGGLYPSIKVSSVKPMEILRTI